MGPPPDASAPYSPDGGFVGTCMRAAAGALRTRPALMAGSMLVIAAANAPQQLAQGAASAGLERMQASAEARGSAAPAIAGTPTRSVKTNEPQSHPQDEAAVARSAIASSGVGAALPRASAEACIRSRPADAAHCASCCGALAAAI
ncbi:MAG: hypothetical protein ACKOFI_01910, partial [Phycisphaerales bacterium]